MQRRLNTRSTRKTKQTGERPVLIQNTSFDGLIPALKTGKLDLVISSMTATAERAQSIVFLTCTCGPASACS